MNLRILASGLLLSLALAGCRTVPVEGDYSFAEHPGKALVVISTRMTAGEPCPYLTVTGQLGFRKAEESVESVSFDMHVPRPARKVSTFSEMAGEEEAMVEADPPTRFAIHEVPAGRHVLNSLIVVVTSPMTRYIADNLPPLSFAVNEGEVVYLGELEVMTRGGDCHGSSINSSSRKRFTTSVLTWSRNA
jgi:hypothetical protein